MVGLGYDHSLSNGLSIRAEVAANSYDDVQTDNGVTTASESNGDNFRSVVSNLDLGSLEQLASTDAPNGLLPRQSSLNTNPAEG